MKPAPAFATYPLAVPPAYSRWLASGVALLALAASVSALIRPFVEARVVAVGVIVTLLLWGLALLLRVLFYRLNQHNAHCYDETVRQVQHGWWQQHRQQVALVDSVLLGAVCQTPEQAQGLFRAGALPPLPRRKNQGAHLFMRQVSGRDSAERERHLARLLAVHWQAQQPESIVVQPLCSYWQGTPDAWQAFVEQMAKACPTVRLPEHPEPWQGLDSLDAIIDQLQGAAADACILCAGCQSSAVLPESRLPAGEAALLWLLGPQGGVRFTRGEWFAADSDSLAALVERAQQQRTGETPVQTCVAFSQPDVPGLADLGWNTQQHLQDSNFGALAGLEGMVALTLAAWYAEQQGLPCAWLANDPHHSLAMGVVEPDDSIH